MPQLEPLNLKLTGSAEGLTATLGRAQGEIKRFGGRVESLAGQFASVASFANPVTIALGAIAAAATVAYKAVSEVREAMTRVDDLTDAANRLGVSFTELRGLRLSLGEATGLEGSAIDAAIAKLQINLGEAAKEGSGKAFEALQQLGLSAGDLLSAGPQRAIEMLAEKISEVQDKSMQLQLSFDILGKSGIAIAAALREAPGALQEASKWARENLGLTEQQVNQIGMANDAWDRVWARVGSIFELVASELSPVLQIIAEDILSIVAGSDEAFEGVSKALESWYDSLIQLYGLFVDLSEIITKTFETLVNIAALDFGSASKSFSELVTFDQGTAYQKRLTAIREEAGGRNRQQPSEAQTEALDSQANALKATQSAADSVSAKANEVKTLVESIKPKALSAVTDRAEQLRRIGELEQKKTITDQMALQRKLNDQVVGRLDRLISAVRDSDNLPPIDLD